MTTHITLCLIRCAHVNSLPIRRTWCLQIELVLTAATFAVAIIGSIAGIFGMNLNNGREDSHAMFLVVSTHPAYSCSCGCQRFLAIELRNSHCTSCMWYLQAMAVSSAQYDTCTQLTSAA